MEVAKSLFSYSLFCHVKVLWTHFHRGDGSLTFLNKFLMKWKPTRLSGCSSYDSRLINNGSLCNRLQKRCEWTRAIEENLLACSRWPTFCRRPNATRGGGRGGWVRLASAASVLTTAKASSGSWKSWVECAEVCLSSSPYWMERKGRRL